MFNWKNRRVLVTGACGFIGSHLTETLVNSGAQVRALVYYNSFNNWGWIDSFKSDIKSKIDIISGDLRDKGYIQSIVSDREIVFHLGALIAIPYSYHAPQSYIDTNTIGTLNILEACKIAEVKKMVHTSTSEVYGTARYVPIDENHPLQGQSPYSASKIGADKLVEAYFCSFNVPVTTIRPFNTYGPRQSARAVIPTIISQILSGKDTIELGSLSPTRDFNYVKDTVNGFIKIAESDKSIGEVINVGSGNEISIEDLVSKIAFLLDKKITIISKDERKRPINSEVERLCANNEKAQKLIEWQPEYTIDEGLLETIEWIKNNQKYFKTGIYNV